MRETVLTPLGLITRPNQYGVYPPGGMSQATNVCFRAPGILEGFEVPAVAFAAFTTSGYSPRKIWCDGWADGANMLIASKDPALNQWTLTRGATAITMIDPWLPGFYAGYANGTFVRDRYIISNSSNPLVIDSATSTTARFAGLQSPRRFEVYSQTTTNAQALLNGKVCAWRCHFKRKMASGYEITGAVSNLTAWTNAAGSTVDVTLLVGWPDDGTVLAGDTVELYRTLAQTSGTDPGDTEYLSLSHTITSAEVAVRYCLLLDSTTDAGLGASLYTNADQLGLAKSFQVPPTSTDIATFKGHTFYVAVSTASSIYTRVPGKWGSLTTAAEVATGIGVRNVTGCTTSAGSAVVLVPNTTGLAAGQRIVYGTDFAAGATVLSVVANTSVTLDTNSAGSHGPVTIVFQDMLRINFEVVSASSLANTLSGITGHTLITVGGSINGPDGSGNVSGAELRFSIPYSWYGTPNIRGTNGSHYSPPIPDYSAPIQSGTADPRTNRLIFSENDQPEACPEGNEVLVGRGTIYRIIPTRDALWCFCSDGLWRLSGEAGVWRVDPVDMTLILAAPNAVDVMRDVVYAYTNRGVVAVSDAGVDEISKRTVENLMPGRAFYADWTTFLACDQGNREVLLTLTGEVTTTYVYHADQQAWSVLTDGHDVLSMTYSPQYQALVYGTMNGTANPYVNMFVKGSDTRLQGSVMQFHPLTGDGNPATLKQFTDLTALFSGLYTSVAVTPYWTGTAGAARNLKFTNGASGLAQEARVTFGVPRAQAVATQLRPGLSIDSPQHWIFRGLSVRWNQVAEESLR